MSILGSTPNDRFLITVSVTCDRDLDARCFTSSCIMPQKPGGTIDALTVIIQQYMQYSMVSETEALLRGLQEQPTAFTAGELNPYQTQRKYGRLQRPE